MQVARDEPLALALAKTLRIVVMLITDAGIKRAFANAVSGKRIQMKEEGERGSGRLSLEIRKGKDRVTAEWYAIWYRAGKRSMLKIGSYPTLSVAEARKKFRGDFAPVISAGDVPLSNRARARLRGTTVKDMFQAYVDHLKAAGSPSWLNVERILITGKHAAAASIGATLLAAKVRPDDITPCLAETHGRGSLAMARMARAYISAAFSFAMKSEHDYTKGASVSWGVTSNPCLAIPVDPASLSIGERHLSPAEFRTFWDWLTGCEAEAVSASAMKIILATGQRVREVLRTTDGTYDRREKMIDWSKTKNKHPHSIPLPPQAAAILDGLTPNEHGMFFPHRDDPTGHLGDSTLEALVGRFLKDHPGIPHFSPRCARRTWKTLAGAAGLSKEIRDRIQNHARSDVSSRHYDRYEYLPEKRAAMAKWSDYMEWMLGGVPLAAAAE
jgi:integrase